jgi:hypothetical protein
LPNGGCHWVVRKNSLKPTCGSLKNSQRLVSQDDHNADRDKNGQECPPQTGCFDGAFAQAQFSFQVAGAKGCICGGVYCWLSSSSMFWG